jgi:uncharacterized protein YbaA (DUF1428 family)
MRYVDGFVIPVPTKKLDAYKKMSAKAAKVWMEHGALDYVESVGDDLNIQGVASFIDLVKPKRGETIVFSWITFKSRAHRDKVNKAVMKDPRIEAMCGEKNAPFDVKRMNYGGFKAIVEG